MLRRRCLRPCRRTRGLCASSEEWTSHADGSRRVVTSNFHDGTASFGPDHCSSTRAARGHDLMNGLLSRNGTTEWAY